MKLLAITLLAVVTHAQAPRDLRVLFIGNSLTSVNDLPALVRRIGEADGVKIQTKMIAVNDASLEDHWKGRDAAREIKRGRWDFVVLQQGPSSLAASRALLREHVGRFSGLIEQSGAKPALYMVWPALARRGDFDRVSESYRLAAADVDGLLLPAGDAWRAAWAIDPSAPLYAHDHFHPSAHGSWLAALVIYCRLADRAPRALTRFPRGFPETRELIVTAADTVLAVR